MKRLIAFAAFISVLSLTPVAYAAGAYPPAPPSGPATFVKVGTPAALASTGSDLIFYLLTAAALLFVGSLFSVIAVRRRH
jgi:hypothetical protein